jgi:hypothetical protein
MIATLLLTLLAQQPDMGKNHPRTQQPKIDELSRLTAKASPNRAAGPVAEVPRKNFACLSPKPSASSSQTAIRPNATSSLPTSPTRSSVCS